MTSYFAKAAAKLRAQGSRVGAVQVYFRTNVFIAEVPLCQWAVTAPLPDASSDTRRGNLSPAYTTAREGLMPHPRR